MRKLILTMAVLVALLVVSGCTITLPKIHPVQPAYECEALTNMLVAAVQDGTLEAKVAEFTATIPSMTEEQKADALQAAKDYKQCLSNNQNKFVDQEYAKVILEQVKVVINALQ